MTRLPGPVAVVKACALAATLILASCTSGADDLEAEAPGEQEDVVERGPAPGVTDTSVRVGVTYVDAAALASAIVLDLGDFEAAYNALIEEINAEGGINGRQIEAVFAPINPVGNESAEQACVELTEDEDVFLAMGFFLNDTVLCTVDAHETAVIGGTITPEWAARARAPWYTWQSGTDTANQAIEMLVEEGELDGRVAVLATASATADRMTDSVLPMLEELEVEVVESAVLDAPVTDGVAVQNAVQTTAARFEASGADTVLLLGQNVAYGWPRYMQDQPYQPLLRFDDMGVDAFVGDAQTTDRSMLDGAIFGGLYGPDRRVYDEPKMQACVDRLREAGVEVAEPVEGVSDFERPWTAAFFACKDVTLLQALLEEAGPDLGHGTLEAAADGLRVEMPGDPDPYVYGPDAAADGDPTVYLYDWDADVGAFEPRSG